MSNTLEYFNDEAGDYCWRVIARESGEIVSASTRGFADLRHAMDDYELSLEPPVQITYPEGHQRGPNQVITLEGQDFSDREEEDADGVEGGTDGSAGGGEQPEGEDPGRPDEAPVGEGHLEGQRDDWGLDPAGSLPPVADGEQPEKGSRRQGRGTHR